MGNDCGLPDIPPRVAWRTVSLGQGFWCGIKMNGALQCGVHSGTCYYPKGWASPELIAALDALDGW